MKPVLPPGLVIEDVHRYLENRTKEFGTLGAAVEARNVEGIRMVAHRIKGNAALYAMPEFGLVAGALTASLDAGDWTEISKKVDALIIKLSEEKSRFSYRS